MSSRSSARGSAARSRQLCPRTVIELPFSDRSARHQLFTAVAVSAGSRRIRASTATQRSARPITGIEVELGDLGIVLGQARQPVKQVGQGRDVRRRAAAEAGDEPAGLAAADELLRVDVGQRGDGEAPRRRSARRARRPARTRRRTKAAARI